jgi:hypothetical protein
VIGEVESVRYLVNPFGRKLRFHNFEHGRLVDREEALAFLPQSTVGDMCKAVLPTIDAISVGSASLLTTTHDSFLFEARQSEVAEVIAAARPIMEREWSELGTLPEFGHFRCPTDAEVGDNWGPYHECEPMCEKPCDKVNPDGMKPWKEAA